MDGSEAMIPLGRAAERIGRSPHTIRKLIRQGVLPIYQRPTDRRARLVRLADLEAIEAPRRFDPKEAAPMAG